MAQRFFNRNRNKNRPNVQQKTYAFIDSQNLNVSTQKAGWKMDWKKFRAYLKDTHKVYEAFMFIGYVPEFEPMYNQLHEAGYKIVLMQTIDLSRPQIVMDEDASEKDKKAAEEDMHIKGNIDADMVLWTMREYPNYQKAIIVSGDGDFRSLIDYLSEKNKLDKILVPNRHFSSLLNVYKDKVVDLTDHRHELSHYDKKRGKGNRNKQSASKLRS